MSSQSGVELQLEFLDPSRPPTPYVERRQAAAGDVPPPFFLMRLVDCKGAWKSVYREGIRKALSKGESPLERQYFLSGRWIKLKPVSSRVTLRTLNRIGGVQGLVASPEPGLYCLLRLSYSGIFPPSPRQHYYDVLWSVLLLEGGRCGDPGDEVVSVLKNKPKIRFEESLLLPPHP